MSKRLISAIKLDMLFQFRSGFYTIYMVLSIIYIIAIRALPKAWGGDIAVSFMIFSDPAVLGFFFIGGLVMLEKGQGGIVDLVIVTPLRIREYVLSKVLSLAIIAIIVSLAIAIFAQRVFNPVILIVSVLLVASFFTMFGCYIAMGSKTINQYFGKVVPMMLVIILPVFSLIEFPYNQLFGIFPSVSSARMIMEAFFGGSGYLFYVWILIMALWNYLMFKVVVNKFESYAITGGGSND